MKTKMRLAKSEAKIYSSFGDCLATLMEDEVVTIINTIDDTAFQVGIGYYQGEFFEIGFMKPSDLKAQFDD